MKWNGIKNNPRALMDFCFGSYLFSGVLLLFSESAGDWVFNSLIGFMILIFANIAVFIVLPAYLLSVVFSFVLAANRLLLSLGILSLVELLVFFSCVAFNCEIISEEQIILPYVGLIILIPLIWFIKLRRNYQGVTKSV